MTNCTYKRFLNLFNIALNEALLFTQKVSQSIETTKSLQQYLKSLSFNHTILEHDQCAIYPQLKYEYIGLDLPDYISDHLITAQHSGAYFSSFLTSLLTAITEKTRGDNPCQVI